MRTIRPNFLKIITLFIGVIWATILSGQDTIPPVIITPGISKTSGCEGANIIGEFTNWFNTGGGTVAMDNSGTYILQPSLTYSNALSRLNASADTLCGNTKNVVVEFRAVDPSNNSSPPIVISFSVIDTLVPVIFVKPTSAFIECNENAQDSLENWIKNKGGSKASDICSPTVDWTIYYYQTSTGLRDSASIADGPYPQIPPGACTWSVIVSFKVVDECGNQVSTPIRTFDVKDTKSPVLSSTPPDITVSCDMVSPPPPITAQDACSGSISVNFTEVSTQQTSVNACNHYNYTLTRKWVAKDACNFETSHTQVITVKDTVGPVISGPSPIDVECELLNTPDSLLILLTDLCSPTFISFVDTFTVPGLCNNQLRRTYRATDVCGNTSSLTQVINIVDQSAPIITAGAQNQGLSCDNALDVNAAFTTWLNNKGGSVATDGCGNAVFGFVAVPNSYVLGDTSTFPGIHPGTLDITTCPSPVAGYTRAEKVDFVFYDVCGNASVTSAYFGLSDVEPPMAINCPGYLLIETMSNGCEAAVSIEIPEAMDNCAQFSSPLVRMTTSPVVSPDPGNNESVVNNVTLSFGNVFQHSITPTGNATLTIDLVNIDADDATEYFNVLDEQGSFIGRTLNTGDQCGNGTTTFTDLAINSVSNWLADGTIQFTLIPNNSSIPVLAINDVCIGSRVNATISIPIDQGNLIETSYTVVGSGDTLIVSAPAIFEKSFEPGLYKVDFLYRDCGQNIGKCSTTIEVVDKTFPDATCPPSISGLSVNDECVAKLELPLLFQFDDNCGFPEDYNQMLPSTSDGQRIIFRYIESSGDHVATNKSVSFEHPPKIEFHEFPARLEVVAKGDLNDITEFFDIIGEGGLILGRTEHNTGPGCGTSTSLFDIPFATYNDWLQDSIITFTAVANNMPGEEGNGINPCNPISSSQTLDQFSTLTFRLIIENPVVRYQVDNGNMVNLNRTDSLKLDLVAGIHSIKFTIADKSGNATTCSTNIAVIDNKPPFALCKSFIARIHPSGLIDYILTPDSINNGSRDNCAIDTMWVVNANFQCSDIGTEKTTVLFVQDNSGNIASCNSTVKIEPIQLKPEFTAGLCEGDTLKLFANVPPPVQQNIYTYEWYLDNVLVSTEENPEFTNAGAGFNGLYRVVVKGLNGCMAEGLLTINIQPLTTPAIMSQADSYCDDGEVVLETTNFSGSISYEWYEGFPPNGILIANTANPELVIHPSVGTHNYYVVARSSSCVSNPSSTRRLTIYKKPLVNLLSVFENVCEGGEIKLGTTTAGQGYLYSWTGPDGYKSDLANPAIIMNAQINNQGKYQLVVAIAACKSDSATTNVAILPKPVMPVITGENIYCEGSTFSLVVNNLPQQEKYTWIKDGIKYRVTTDNALEILNVPTSISGSWQVIVESNGCLSDTSAIKDINIDNLTVIGASNSGPACVGDTIDLGSTFVPNASYQWSGPDGFKKNGQQVKAIALPGEYFVTITTTTGCQNVTSTVVEVNAAPVITALSNNGTTCMDGKTDLLFSPSIIPAGNYTYTWTGPNNFNQTIANARITNAKPTDNGIYVLRVFNKNCPSKPDTSVVNINLIPDKAFLAAPAKLCEGDTLILSTTSIADSYQWHTPLGTFTTNEPVLKIANVSKANEGNYHCLVTVGPCTSQNFDLKFVAISDRPLPVAITGKSEWCFGDTLELHINSTDIEAALWQLPGNNTVNTPVLKLDGVTEADEGIYRVIIYRNGCVSSPSLDFFVSIRDQILKPIPKSNVVEICHNDDIGIELCIDPFDPTAGLTYQWEFESGTLIGQSSSACILINNEMVDVGDQLVRVFAIKDGCTSLEPGLVLVSKKQAPNIKAEANIDVTTTCGKDDIVQLTSEIQPPEVGINWTSLSGSIEILTPESGSTLITAFKPGLNVVLLTYSKPGCPNFTSDTVQIYLLEAPDAKDDAFDGEFNEDLFFDVLLNDNVGIFYELQFEAFDETAGNIEAVPGGFIFTPNRGYSGVLEIPYKLCIQGCPNLCDNAIARLRIGFDVPCEPPTIITPNGDGINDEFVIPCISSGKYPQNELIIFNQWGDQVYQSRPYNNDWAGTYGNDALPPGTYYFVFNPGTSSNRLNGFLIIQR